MIDVLPRDVWANIRSFSGDTGYEPTPTAKLLRDLTFVFGTPPVNGETFLSTLVMSKDADFLVIYRDLLGNSLPDVSKKHFMIFTRKEKDAANV